jgi:hypothetical protein
MIVKVILEQSHPVALKDDRNSVTFRGISPIQLYSKMSLLIPNKTLASFNFLQLYEN